MNDINNITDDELDSAFDSVSQPTPIENTIYDGGDEIDDVDDNDTDDESDDDIEDDIPYTPEPDEITDDEMALDGIEENDLVVVNKDGSYVVISQDLAEKLLSNPTFIDMLDSGFESVDEFSDFVSPILQDD